MIKQVITLASCALFVVVAIGCAPEAIDGTAASGDATPVAATGDVLCGQCGHDKGSEACCSDDCTSCEKCGLHEGSELCCAVSEAAAGKDMCAKCGHAAGESCCEDECETCADCGKHAGSELCCKQEAGTETAEATADNGEEAAEASGDAGSSAEGE